MGGGREEEGKGGRRRSRARRIEVAPRKRRGLLMRRDPAWYWCPIKYIMSLSLSRYSSRAVARNDRTTRSECI